MTTPSEKLKAIRDEQARKKAEFDAEQAKLIEAVRLENEAAIAAEEAAAKAAEESAAKAEVEAQKAYDAAEAARKKAAEAAKQHKTLFGKSAAVPSSVASASASGWLEKGKELIPTLVKFAVLALVAWALIWGYFAVANFLGERGQVENAQVTDPSSTFVPEAPTAEPTLEPAVADDPTLEPTTEPTATTAVAVKAPASTQKPKPDNAKPTSVAPAPAIPITWNSGPTATYKPVAGMICHGDQVGPFGSSDGTRPVIVQFWSDQPEPLVMNWASCEVNTGRNLSQIKVEIEAKYSKTFEVVNN
jgi:hypothetical protein